MGKYDPELYRIKADFCKTLARPDGADDDCRITLREKKLSVR